MDLDPASWGGLELGLNIGPVKTSTVVPTLWLNSVKLKGVSSRFYNKTYKDK